MMCHSLAPTTGFNFSFLGSSEEHSISALLCFLVASETSTGGTLLHPSLLNVFDLAFRQTEFLADPVSCGNRAWPLTRILRYPWNRDSLIKQ